MAGESAPVLGMVLKGYPRISETFISNEIRLLEELGYRIHIFSMRRPREEFSHESVKKIDAAVTYLPEDLFRGLPRLLWANLKCAARRPGRYLRALRLALSRFRGAPKKDTWLKHFLQAAYLAEKSQGLAIAHLHAHFAHTPASVAMYSAILLGVEYSFTAHAKDIYTQSPARLAEKIRRADFVFTCTRGNEERLRPLAEEQGKIHCVHHGIDLSLFSGNGRPLEARPPYQILTVSRFVEKKGLPTVFEALRLLKDKGFAFRYHLVGNGPDRPKLVRKLASLGLMEDTVLTGTIPHEKVLSLYRQAQLFVLGCRQGSDGDRDGIPNVVAEAMAMGVPVAATDFASIPELVVHGETGLLAPPDSPQALAENMAQLLADGDLRRRIIPAARHRVESIFDNRALAGQLAELYASHGVHAAPTGGS